MFEIIIDNKTKLYNTFEQLFYAVEKNSPYKNDSFYFPLTMANFCSKKNHRLLFKNGKIKWHSDNFSYDEASILTISKGEDCFKVQFKRSTNKEGFTTHNIRICNEGSRYDPFNVTFMNMYNELLNYEYNNDNMACLRPVKNRVKKNSERLIGGYYDNNRW